MFFSFFFLWGCPSNFYYELDTECVCGTQSTSCGDGNYCYEDECKEQAKCFVREDKQKNAFHGAYFSGEWDSQNRRMILELPMTSDITLVSVMWMDAQNVPQHSTDLAYANDNTGIWTLDTSDPCKTKYQFDTSQDIFFGEGSHFTMNGTHMQTVLE